MIDRVRHLLPDRTPGRWAPVGLCSLPFLALLVSGCAVRSSAGTSTEAAAAAHSGVAVAAAAPMQIAVRDDFTGPEAVRYDPDQDVYFVSNFGEGGSGALDNNGFISRMNPDGVVQQLRFIAGGTNGVTLHGPRGMTIVGDTLWVADADAVRGFDRRTGAPLAMIDFSAVDRGFLNDVAAAPDGEVYVTDTGRNRIYRVRGGVVTALETPTLGAPNGITWDAAREAFVVVPYGGMKEIYAWSIGADSLIEIGTGPGGRYDGVEVLRDGAILVASQADSSLHLFTDGVGRPIIRISGPPADIAVDTRRHRVAVPIIRLNRVEIWTLPE